MPPSVSMLAHVTVRFALVVCLVLGSLIVERVALACSCSGGTVGRSRLPPPGTTGFPTDGAIRVLFHGGLSAEIVAGLGAEYRLRDDSGKLVPLRSTADGRLLTLRPVADLQPNHTYTVERVFVYSSAKKRLTDTERAENARRAAWRARFPEYADVDVDGPRLASIAEKRWYPDGTFTTASGPEEKRKLEAPRLKSAKIGFSYGGGDCGPGSHVSIYYQPPRALDPTTDLLTIEIDEPRVVHRFVHDEKSSARTREGGLLRWMNAPVFRTGFGDTLCIPDKVYVGSSEKLRARAVVVSASGGVVKGKWSPVVPFEPYRRDIAKRASDQWSNLYDMSADAVAQRAAEADDAAAAQLEHFFAKDVPAKPPRDATASGPSECPFGLRRKAAFNLPEGELPWMSGSSISLGSRKGRFYTVYADGDQRRSDLVEFDLAGHTKKTRIPGIAHDAVAAFESNAVFAALVAFERQGASTIRVLRMTYDGTVEWEHRIEAGMVQWHPRIIVNGGRVLVAWNVTNLDTLASPVHWIVLSTADGKPASARPNRSEDVLGGSDGNLALGRSGDGFIMAWTPEQATISRRDSKVLAARIDRRGKLSAIRKVSGERGYRLDVVGERLLYGTPSAVKMTRMDEAATPETLVDGGGPRGAVKGRTLYLVWRAREGASVTGIGPDGRVAEPTAVPGSDTLPAIAATDDGVVLVYGRQHGRLPQAAQFTCATEPAAGAPSRLPSR